MVARHEIPLRFADLDMLGHVNNVRAMELIQEARVSLMRDFGYELNVDVIGENFEGVAQVIARAEVDYLRPILLSHRVVTVETTVGRVGRSSYDLKHVVVVPDGTEVMRATSVMVCVSPQTGASAPIPDTWRAVLESELVKE